VNTCATSDELGFYTAHKPGALTRYFAERWLEEPSAKGEQLIAWLLEAALGRNTLYFIEKTEEYIDEWRGSGEVVPVNAFDGFVLTGDPVEDTIIPHAIFVWRYMNDQPWSEEVYHRWLDKLLAAGSAEAAYLAASLWPAHDLMEKVTYRPAAWLVYRGQLDAEAERLILTEMLKWQDGLMPSLYGPFEYDDVAYPEQLAELYIVMHGFTHPICGLVDPIEVLTDIDLSNLIQKALAAPSWSEGVKDAAMLLYLSFRATRSLGEYAKKILDLLEQNFFKLDEKHINIINFHVGKTEKIEYGLIKDYINYLIILYNQTINKDEIQINKRIAVADLKEIFAKYISIGLKTKDMLYIGKYIKKIISYLMLEEKEKIELWIKNQADDLRIKDTLLAVCMNCRPIHHARELAAKQVEKEIEDIYGKINHFDKISLLIDQNKIYYNREETLLGVDEILQKEEKLNLISYHFIEDIRKIINSWHPNRNNFSEKDMFLISNHVGLYLYYEILRIFDHRGVNFINHIKEEGRSDLYLGIKNKIVEGLYRKTMSDIKKADLYLNKIEYNNLPCEEIKRELIIELINIIENDDKNLLEFLKDRSKLFKLIKVICSNIELIENEFGNSRLIGLFGIDNRKNTMILY